LLAAIPAAHPPHGMERCCLGARGGGRAAAAGAALRGGRQEALPDHVRRGRRVAPRPITGRDWERPRSSPKSEGDAVSDLDRLEAAAGECREMIREAHAATKDLRAAVREAKTELHALTRDEVAAHIQLEVSRQLEELDERTREAISAATQKVIAEFDRFGESLLGKETYWQKASGRRAVPRPDTEVVTLDVQPDQDKG